MRTLFILAVLVAVAFANKHKFHHQSEEGHHHHHKEHKCRGEPIIPDKEFEKSRRECHREIKKEEDESEGKKSGRSCRAVCAMTKVGALDDKGFIVESKLKNMIHSSIVNQEARKEMEDEVIACGRNATDLGIARSDHKCSNYKPYFHCVWLSIVAICADPFAHNDEQME